MRASRILAESQNLRGVIFMRQGDYDQARRRSEGASRPTRNSGTRASIWLRSRFCGRTGREARKRFEALLTAKLRRVAGRSGAAHPVQDFADLHPPGEGEHGRFDPRQVRAFDRYAGGQLLERRDCAPAQEEKEAKEWIAAAEKNFSPQLNKLFAESLYEVGWLQKPAGQTRAALEITSAAERTAKAKAIAQREVRNRRSRRFSNVTDGCPQTGGRGGCRRSESGRRPSICAVKF